MFILEKLGALLNQFQDLKYDGPIFESFMCGTARRQKYITYGKKLGSIYKETENKPLSAVF